MICLFIRIFVLMISITIRYPYLRQHGGIKPKTHSSLIAMKSASVEHPAISGFLCGNLVDLLVRDMHVGMLLIGMSTAFLEEFIIRLGFETFMA